MRKMVFFILVYILSLSFHSSSADYTFQSFVDAVLQHTVESQKWSGYKQEKLGEQFKEKLKKSIIFLKIKMPKNFERPIETMTTSKSLGFDEKSNKSRLYIDTVVFHNWEHKSTKRVIRNVFLDAVWSTSVDNFFRTCFFDGKDFKTYPSNTWIKILIDVTSQTDKLALVDDHQIVNMICKLRDYKLSLSSSSARFTFYLEEIVSE